MGEMAELEIERQEMSAFIHDCNALSLSIKGKPLKSQKVIWVTRDGQRIEIKDMKTSHIRNSIAKCKRDNWRLEAIPYLETELQSRTKHTNT